MKREKCLELARIQACGLHSPVAVLNFKVPTELARLVHFFLKEKQIKEQKNEERKMSRTGPGPGSGFARPSCRVDF